MKRFITIGVLGAAALAAPLRMVPQINNADARGYFARGVAMYQDRNYNGCIDQLLQLRNLNATPDEQRDALYYVAMSTYHCGDDEALDLLREYLSRYPQSPMCGDVTMTAGDYFFTRGIYADALKEYVKVSPESVTADRADDLMYRTAYCYMFLGEYGKAKGMFSRLTSTSVYGNAAKFYLAYMEYSERNYAKAIEMFETVDVTREPGQAAMYYLSQLYYMEKDYGKSLAMARKAIVSGAVPEFEPELNRVAGESLYNMGDTSEAVAYLQKYVSSTDNPEPSACYMLGVCHYNDADYATAAEFLKRAVSGDSAMGQSAYLYLGQCFVKTGNRDAAQQAHHGLRPQDEAQKDRHYNGQQGGHHHFPQSALGTQIHAGGVIRVCGSLHDAGNLPKLPPDLHHDGLSGPLHAAHGQGGKHEGQHSSHEDTHQHGGVGQLQVNGGDLGLHHVHIGHQKGQGNKTIGTRTEQHIRYLLDKWRARRREQRRAEKRQAREHQHDHPQIQRVQRPTATKGKQRQPDYEHERKDVEGHLHRHAGN